MMDRILNYLYHPLFVNFICLLVFEPIEVLAIGAISVSICCYNNNLMAKKFNNKVEQ